MTTAKERAAAAAESWTRDLRVLPGNDMPAYVEPAQPLPYDMTTAAGTFTRSESMSLHRCANCQRGIPVGVTGIAHRLWATSHVTNYYHESCVILP